MECQFSKELNGDPKPNCWKCGEPSKLRCCYHGKFFCLACQPGHDQPGKCFYAPAAPLRLLAVRQMTLSFLD